MSLPSLTVVIFRSRIHRRIQASVTPNLSAICETLSSVTDELPIFSNPPERAVRVLRKLGERMLLVTMENNGVGFRPGRTKYTLGFVRGALPPTS